VARTPPACIDLAAIAFQSQALNRDWSARPLRAAQPRSAPFGRVVDLFQQVKPNGQQVTLLSRPARCALFCTA